MARQWLKLVFLLYAACIISFVSSQKDDTLTDFAKGKDVAEATIRKIFNSQTFPDDHSFLIRLAYVETRFGTDNSTFRPNYNGGIWQVDEDAFDATKSTSLTPLHQAILTNFNINWITDVTWKSCLAPLYSALSAALYFNQITPPIPDKINGQASHWKRYYRPEGNETKFSQDSEELRNETVCRGKMDMALILDGSGSIDPPDFVKAKDFVSDMIRSFTLDFTRIGMVVYSTNTQDIFWIENNLNISAMADLAKAAYHPRGGTSTDLGIRRGIALHNNATRIDGIPRINMVFTDGHNTGFDLPGAIAEIITNNITSVAIGIGTGINQNELKFIALNETRRVFTLSDFNALHDFLFELRTIACEIPQQPVINGTYEDGLIENEKRLYELSIPATGLTIGINVISGKMNGYWSRTERVPNSAVHDGIIDGVTFIPPATMAVKRVGVFQMEGETSTVYISVEGVEPVNNYTFVVVEGNEVPYTYPPDIQTPSPSSSSSSIVTQSTAPATIPTTTVPLSSTTSDAPKNMKISLLPILSLFIYPLIRLSRK